MKPKVVIKGQVENVFLILKRAAQALKKHGESEQTIDSMREDVIEAGNRHEAMTALRKYVDIG